MSDPVSRRRRFAVLRGGLEDGDDWRSFCRRIGWQALSEPVLPDDYEEQLAARIFGASGDNVVSLAHERARRGLADAADAWPQPTLPARATPARWPLWCALAVLAAIGLGTLLASGRGDAPPAAVVPVPEISTPPLPLEDAPPPPIVDPGERHARAPTPPPRRPTAAPPAALQREASPPEVSPPEASPVAAALSAVDAPADFDPDPDPDDAVVIDVMALPYPLPPVPGAVAALDGRAPAVTPDWLTLDAPLASAATPVALVDVVEAGQRLGQL